jgi:hypothetical protein
MTLLAVRKTEKRAAAVLYRIDRNAVRVVSILARFAKPLEEEKPICVLL